MSQEPPKQPEPEQPKKPGPHEKLHSLHPLTLGQALDRAFRFKPKPKPIPAKRKPKT